MWRDTAAGDALADDDRDPRHRDLLRRDLRGRRRRDGTVRRERRRLAGRVPRALRRRRAGDRLAAPPRAGRPGGARGAGRRRARRCARSTASRSPPGPGLVGALLVGVSAAKAYAYASGRPLVPVDHLHGHVASLFLAPDAVEPPLLVLLASGGHTLLLRVDDARPLRRARPLAGRRRRRGASTRARGCSGSATPAARRSSGCAPRRRPGRASPCRPRWRAAPGSTSRFSGLKTALLHRVQARQATLERGPRRPRGRLPAGRSCERSSSAPWRPRSPTTCRPSASSAAWRPTASCARRWPRPPAALRPRRARRAAGLLRRQRRDDRLGGALPPGARLPGAARRRRVRPRDARRRVAADRGGAGLRGAAALRAPHIGRCRDFRRPIAPPAPPTYAFPRESRAVRARPVTTIGPCGAPSWHGPRESGAIRAPLVRPAVDPRPPPGTGHALAASTHAEVRPWGVGGAGGDAHGAGACGDRLRPHRGSARPRRLRARRPPGCAEHCRLPRGLERDRARGRAAGAPGRRVRRRPDEHVDGARPAAPTGARRCR